MAVYAVTGRGEVELDPELGRTAGDVLARIADFRAKGASLTGSAERQPAPADEGDVWLNTVTAGAVRLSEVREFRTYEPGDDQ